MNKEPKTLKNIKVSNGCGGSRPCGNPKCNTPHQPKTQGKKTLDIPCYCVMSKLPIDCECQPECVYCQTASDTNVTHKAQGKIEALIKDRLITAYKLGKNDSGNFDPERATQELLSHFKSQQNNLIERVIEEIGEDEVWDKGSGYGAILTDGRNSLRADLKAKLEELKKSL